MWTCPKCERNFKTKNQSHSCTKVEMGELFVGKSDDLVLAFDELLIATADWQPNSVGTAKNSIVFTSQKAWLIIKPMKKELDIKFYHATVIESDRIKKVTDYSGKFAHHIRVKHPDQIDSTLIKLINKGFRYSLMK